jgi:hypothetical protein
VLRFFYEKRGFKFAAAAAGWRFVYDLYSWVGFWYGTGDSAFVAVQRLAHFTFSKIDALALGVAVGAVFALGLFSATGILILRPGTHEAKGLLELLSQFMPGYEVSWRGASIGSLQAFVYGYAFGALFAAIRNFSMRVVMGVEKVNRARTARNLLTIFLNIPPSMQTNSQPPMAGTGEEQKLLRMILNINAQVLGLTLGILLGLGLFVATLVLVIKGGPEVGPHLGLLNQFFIGYSVTYLGSLTGGLYGFAVGYVGGWIIGAIYNGVVYLRSR